MRPERKLPGFSEIAHLEAFAHGRQASMAKPCSRG
jgi:hypothetical protein